jgi:hypothetical protein
MRPKRSDTRCRQAASGSSTTMSPISTHACQSAPRSWCSINSGAEDRHPTKCLALSGHATSTDKCPLSGVLRLLGSSSVNYANKIGHFLTCLLPRKWRWEAHGKQDRQAASGCRIFLGAILARRVFELSLVSGCCVAHAIASRRYESSPCRVHRRQDVRPKSRLLPAPLRGWRAHECRLQARLRAID